MSGTPFNERVELHSDEWISKLKELASQKASEWNEELAGVNFSLSERYENAPPHLGLADNVASVTIRFQEASVTVERVFDPSADLVREGEYQLALPISQAIGPNAFKRARKHQQHLFGDRAMRVSGQEPEGRIAVILQEIHNYLGRRTLENPDLDHRIDAQGVRRHVEELEENGYTIIENAISHEFADEVAGLIVDELSSQRDMNSNQNQIFSNFAMGIGRPIEEIAIHPTLRTVMESTLGKGMILQTTAAALKGPGAGGLAPHVDILYQPEPYPSFSVTAVAVWAFDGDWTIESGPTYMVPGSHKTRRSPRPGEAMENAVPIVMPKGSVVLFSGIWHWQGPRTQASQRISMHNVYQRPFMRLIDDYSKVDAILSRNSPVMSTLLGKDDFYEKATIAGVDVERAVYMDKLIGNSSFDAVQRADKARDTDEDVTQV